MGEEGGHGGREKERGKGFQRQMRGSGDDPRPTGKADRQGTCFYALFFSLFLVQNIFDTRAPWTATPALIKVMAKRQS